MKKSILSVILTLSLFSAYCQSDDYYVKFDSTLQTNFSTKWDPAFLNQVVQLLDPNNQNLLLIILPANGSKLPVPGVYPFADGKKRAIKKGSQIAKLEYRTRVVSVENGGTLTVTEKEGIYTFKAENVPMVDNKTNEAHMASFVVSMFIAP